MEFIRKIRVPLIILILLILIVISIIIVRNILTVASNKNDALDFASEMPTNLDDIFASDFLNEDVGVDTTVTDNSNLGTSVVDNTSTDVVNIEQVVKPSVNLNKEIEISKFIIDKYDASRRSPTYITTIFNASPEVEYASVKFFARRLSSDNQILSRELIFALPSVYVANGQGQTQFYFAGRYAASSRYIRDGRYIIYAEIVGYDKNGVQVASTGQYPTPQFDNVITLRK